MILRCDGERRRTTRRFRIIDRRHGAHEPRDADYAKSLSEKFLRKVERPPSA